jgi:two-component system, OmpR family, sensor kinase
LAQLTAVVGVGLTIWEQSHQRDLAAQGIEQSMPAKTIVDAAASTMQYGGMDALHQLLARWQNHPMPQVYVVDVNGKDILQRNVPKEALASAMKIADEEGHVERFVQKIKDKAGQTYLLFVPEFSHGDFLQPSPPSHPDESGLKEGPPPPEMGADRHVFRNNHMFPFRPLLAGVLVSFIFAALLAWYFSKPIKNLKLAFEEATKGNLNVRVSHEMGHRRDELADLGRDFDAMATRLGSLMQGQTRLLHHVSHELRSPLARIQMATGLAKQNDDKVPSSLDRIERESERMDKLVGELLQLSRLESGVMSFEKERVEVTALLESVLDDAKFEAESKGIKINTLIMQNFVVIGEAELLHRAIENIVRNAIKYSPESGFVMIKVYPHTSRKVMQMVISDQGPGVLENELVAIFQPFVRSSQANNETGHGIGLAIAKQIIEGHGGQIVAKNIPFGGLEIQIELPYVS